MQGISGINISVHVTAAGNAGPANHQLRGHTLEELKTADIKKNQLSKFL